MTGEERRRVREARSAHVAAKIRMEYEARMEKKRLYQASEAAKLREHRASKRTVWRNL